MAIFEIAFRRTGGIEGGYVNDPTDRGGETYKGVARKMHPRWQGWEIVDRHKPLRKGAFIESSMLERLVLEFYKKEFWDRVQGDKLRFQNVANQLYDMAVNAGPKTAIKLFQKSAGIPQTGVMDTLTLLTLNNAK